MDKKERFTGLISIKFTVRFHKDEVCYKYLSDIKWENGYACKKCQSMVSCIGVKPHSRRCIKCGNNERPTLGTMFDKSKVPIHIAFHESARANACNFDNVLIINNFNCSLLITF